VAPITILTGINNSGKSSLISLYNFSKVASKLTGGFGMSSIFSGERHNLGSFGIYVES